MELDNIELMKDYSLPTNAIEEEIHLQLTDEIETQILDALAGYLKDTIKTNEVCIHKHLS